MQSLSPISLAKGGFDTLLRAVVRTPPNGPPRAKVQTTPERRQYLKMTS